MSELNALQRLTSKQAKDLLDAEVSRAVAAGGVPVGSGIHIDCLDTNGDLIDKQSAVTYRVTVDTGPDGLRLTVDVPAAELPDYDMQKLVQWYHNNALEYIKTQYEEAIKPVPVRALSKVEEAAKVNIMEAKLITGVQAELDKVRKEALNLRVKYTLLGGVAGGLVGLAGSVLWSLFGG